MVSNFFLSCRRIISSAPSYKLLNNVEWQFFKVDTPVEIVELLKRRCFLTHRTTNLGGELCLIAYKTSSLNTALKCEHAATELKCYSSLEKWRCVVVCYCGDHQITFSTMFEQKADCAYLTSCFKSVFYFNLMRTAGQPRLMWWFSPLFTNARLTRPYKVSGLTFWISIKTSKKVLDCNLDAHVGLTPRSRSPDKGGPKRWIWSKTQPIDSRLEVQGEEQLGIHEHWTGKHWLKSFERLIAKLTMHPHMFAQRT